jgi:hypothetical protein
LDVFVKGIDSEEVTLPATPELVTVTTDPPSVTSEVNMPETIELLGYPAAMPDAPGPVIVVTVPNFGNAVSYVKGFPGLTPATG